MSASSNVPELAEVEFFRKRWSAGHGAKVLAVRLHEGKKVFRGCSTALLKQKLAGARLVGHQQVTDAYLLGLALRRGGLLATLDERIAALTEPGSAERKAVEILA